MLEDQQQFHPICAEGHECVGWGIDMFGKPTAFPVVHLSYDPSRSDKKFNGLSEPLEVVANHVANPVWSYVDGAHSFPRVEDFAEHVNTQYAGASPVPQGTSGVYSDGFTSVFNEWFQKTDDRALSVVRASKSIISMSLPVDPVTKTRQYRFDRHAEDFVNSLPPAYETEDHKEQFRHFIQYYGTQFAVSASMGGRVEQYSSWKTWLTEPRLWAFTEASLARNAQIDFTKATGITGPTSAHDEGYNTDTVVVEPLHCKGGDPTVSCQANFQQWGKTVDTSPPILLDYGLAPISDLITDPNVSLAMQAAIKDYYLEQQLAWADTNKCPVNCGPSGAGTCTWEGQTKQSSCQCTYSGLVGRQCTGCAPVTVKGTFTDVNGKVYSSSTATVGCSGQPKTVWTGQGVCRCGVGDIPSYSCDDAAATVSCARRANGNLVAYVSQGVCTATCDDAGCDEPPCCDPVQSTPCGAFEGNAGNTSPATTTASAEVSAKGQIVRYGRSQCSKVPYKKKLIPCRVRAKCEFL